MNRTAVYIILSALLVACAQSVVKVSVAAPSPTAGPVVMPTPVGESTMVVPSSTAVFTVTPVCDPVKIMPLGDSITYGEGLVSYGGYRNLLGALLESDGIYFDFVGSQRSGEEVLADPDHEGHPGWRIPNVRESIATDGWLETYQPDIILLHIGSNDVRNDNSNDRQYMNLGNILNELSALLDDILVRLPETHIIVARIIRTRWGSDSNHAYYNNMIPELAASKGARVSVVDMQDILSKSDFVSLYHPSPKGYDKMAHVWETAILALDLGKCAAP